MSRTAIARLLFAALLGVFLGVGVRSFVPLGLTHVAGLIAVALSALVISRFSIRAAVLAALLLGCALGIVRMSGAVLVDDPALRERLDTGVILEGVVSDEPDIRENGARISIDMQKLITNEGTITVGAGVLALAANYRSISYGDRVRVKGKLRLPQTFDAGSGRQFNYPAFLAKDGIGYELAFAKIEKIGQGYRNPLKAAAIYLKEQYVRGLGYALSEPQAGLAAGITAGDKRALGKDLTAIFRAVGLVHIVVLSGYNIMVVIGFIEWLFRRAPRWLRFSLGIFVAILFALITGLASSSVRAAAMAIIATAGKATGRIYLASRALALVAFMMVMWNPWVLAFDPGFQLSFIATLGLIYVSPIVSPRLSCVPKKFGLREITAATIGTQISVLPLLLYSNGQLSLVALPANLLALAVVPYAMLASFIAGVVGLIAGPLASIIGFPAYVLLSYILNVAQLAAAIPFATLSIPAFSCWWLMPVYLALSLWIFLTRENKRIS